MRARVGVLAGTLALTALDAAGEPASAIPWLTESLLEPQTAISAARLAPVTEGPIAAPSQAGIGVLTPQMSGLPPELWGDLDATAAAQALRPPPTTLTPAATALYLRMLLAETNPPKASEGVDFLLARIDQLMAAGALQQAEALLDRAKPDTPALFRRWFDVEMLTGHGDKACAALQASPMLAPSLKVRIFCLARRGDWDAAGIALSVASRIDALPGADADLLALFIDPSLIEEIAPPGPSDPMRVLEFVIRETVGLPISRSSLPLAFLHADTARYVPIRFRMEALERLVEAGALPPGPLFAAYKEEVPAASGGVWDRAAAVQALDLATDEDALAPALLSLDRVMAPVGLRSAAAAHYAPLIGAFSPERIAPDARALGARYLLLGGTPLNGGWVLPEDPGDLQVAAFVQGSSAFLPPDLPDRTRAIVAPFQTADPATLLPPEVQARLERQAPGQRIVAALQRLSPDEDADDLARGLAALRLTGQDDAARQIAVELLLLGGAP